MIQAGVIEAIGNHRLLCGDITMGSVARVMRNERADVIYSDPPWGEGNQKYWHTIQQRGSLPRTSWDGFLDIFCKTCIAFRKPSAPVFVDMGKQWTEQLRETMRQNGLSFIRGWIVLYGNRRKPLEQTLSLFGRDVPGIIWPEEFPFGLATTRAVLNASVRPGDIVLDPCTGCGDTAKITHKLGGCFRGTELNPNRLEETAEWLRKNVKKISLPA